MNAEKARIITCQECKFWTRTANNTSLSVSGTCETYYIANNRKVEVIKSTISFRPCTAKDNNGNYLFEQKVIQDPYPEI